MIRYERLMDRVERFFIETAKSIKASSNWEAIKVELDRWKNDAFETMKNCTPDQLPRLQAEVKSYDKVKNLPDIVIDREE